MRFRRRTDSNHAEIVRALKQIGCSVLDLSAVGAGCPDILIGYRGRNVLVEIKRWGHIDKPQGRHERETAERQKRFRDGWNGLPVAVVDSIEQAVLVATAAQGVTR